MQSNSGPKKVGYIRPSKKKYPRFAHPRQIPMTSLTARLLNGCVAPNRDPTSFLNAINNRRLNLIAHHLLSPCSIRDACLAPHVLTRQHCPDERQRSLWGILPYNNLRWQPNRATTNALSPKINANSVTELSAFIPLGS